MSKHEFAKYIYNFYGKGGLYPLMREGKYLTLQQIKDTLPLAHTLMGEQGWNWGDGDSMDREFIREQLYEKVMGYAQEGRVSVSFL